MSTQKKRADVNHALLGTPGLFLLSKCIDGNGESLEKGAKRARVIHHAEQGVKQKFLLLTRILQKTFSTRQVGTRAHTATPILEMYISE